MYLGDFVASSCHSASLKRWWSARDMSRYILLLIRECVFKSVYSYIVGGDNTGACIIGGDNIGVYTVYRSVYYKCIWELGMCFI